MTSSLGRRIFLAHLELSYRLGRRVTLAEFGELIAREMGREPAFTAAAVSRWESGSQIPTPAVIEAIASLTRTDPGWLSHGEKTSAPAPSFRHEHPMAEPTAPSQGAVPRQPRSKIKEVERSAEPEKATKRRRPE